MSRQLFKSVFRSGSLTPSLEFSPITNLAHTLTATAISTPCRRLSMSSLASEESLGDLDIPIDFDDSPVWDPSPDKENKVTPAIRNKRRRNSQTPLRQIQNSIFERSPSPKRKRAKQHSGMKCEYTSPNSRDSGFSESETGSIPGISCPKPALPKLDLDASPPKMDFMESPTEERKFRSFASLTTSLAEEDFMMDLVSNTPRPTNFNNLISAPFAVETPEPPNARPPIRRCLSMIESSPNGPLAVSSPRKDLQLNQFKRPCSPAGCQPLAKRRKQNSECSPLECPIVRPRKVKRSPLPVLFKSPTIQRSVSDSHIAIMKALNKSENRDELTGDFSRNLALPTITCGVRHPELKNINPDTISDLLLGKYQHIVKSFKIMDCRYPYEYNGGHINGAINWPSLESASKFFESVKGRAEIAPTETARSIIIFHCEFSAERGPKASRYLRELDRTMHKAGYPALHFPEMYLLEGGYKAFFNSYPELCSPQSYTKMLDRKYSEDMKFCRAKSKTFANESKFGKGRCTVSRTASANLFGLRS